jgi:hypothetical protein
MRPNSGWWKEGIMEMGSSPAMNEEVEMDREGERGDRPKKETVGGAVVIVIGLPFVTLSEGVISGGLVLSHWI